jgi:HEAT repeat protein
MPVNKRTSIVLAVIAVILVGAWAGTGISRARKTGKYLEDLAGQKPDKVMDAMNELRLRGAAAGPAIVGLLGSGETTGKARAAWLLGIIGYAKAGDALTTALQDEAPDVRVAALQSLGHMRIAAAASAIQGLLADDKQDMLVRRAAAYALGQIGGEGNVAPLTKVLADHPAPVPEPPADAPATPAADAPKPPPDETIELRKAAASALGQMGLVSSTGALNDSLEKAAEPNAEVRVAIAYALGDIAARTRGDSEATQVLDGLLAGLKDKVGDVRIACAYGLRKATIPRDRQPVVAEALRKAKDDSHYWVRQAAGETMLALRVSE